MNIALINTNRISPPIAPIGLDYVAEGLNRAGHTVRVLDLCWSGDPSGVVTGDTAGIEREVARFFGRFETGLVGLTLRNTDDCAYTSQQSFMDEFATIVDAVRRHTDGFLLLGGVGFSVMPGAVLERCGADAGIRSDGEAAVCELVRRLEQDGEWSDVPGLIFRRGGAFRQNPPDRGSLTDLPPMSRSHIDNSRYFAEGGQAGVETKRGCNRRCIYCADPIAKGRKLRTRPPEAIVDELESLLVQGIDYIHTCDSEFNLPLTHAHALCEQMIRRGLGKRLRWYAYCSPAPFTAETADLMSRSGCVGINFGTDHGDPRMLKVLGRDFDPEDILVATRLCRERGITVMLDLLLGGPGETRESMTAAIEHMKTVQPDQVGISLGLRVYPGTPLAQMGVHKRLESEAPPKGQSGETSGAEQSADPYWLEPRFFLEPKIAPFAFELLHELIGGDRRFLFFDPERSAQDYNYNANERLAEAIRNGQRGAYWDILRRL
jgi:hypothetical protein